MEKLFMTKELHDKVEIKIEEHNDLTHNSVDFGDILFTWFNNEDFNSRGLLVLNDWDEGKNNDPFWDEVRNEHSAVSFIIDMCLLIQSENDYHFNRDFSYP